MNTTIPDIYDRVEYKGRAWRVDGHLKRVTIKRSGLMVKCLGGEPTIEKLAWCVKEEAEFVSIYALCGAIVKINEVNVIAEERNEQAKQAALSNITDGDYVEIPQKYI